MSIAMKRIYFIVLILCIGPSLPLQAQTQPDPAAPPAVTPPPAAAVPAAPTPTTTAARAPTEPSPVVLNAGTASYRSMMFSAGDIDAIRQAADAYHGAAPAELTDGLENAGKDLMGTLMQRRFYLSSIVYHSPVDWAVWLRDQEFTPDTRAQDELTLVSLTRKQVTFLWKPHQLSFYLHKNTHVSDPNIHVNSAGGGITFTLYTNQTFLPAAMQISEGWIPDQQLSILLPDFQGLPNFPDAGLPGKPTTTRNEQGLPTAPLPSVPTVGLKNSPSIPPPSDLILKK